MEFKLKYFDQQIFFYEHSRVILLNLKSKVLLVFNRNELLKINISTDRQHFSNFGILYNQ
jgi:hypothetical protein